MALIPQFPLKLVVFEGEDVNLHIFEERYKQLVLESFENKTVFGIPSVIDDKRLASGTTVRIKEISKIYPDGKMDIKTKGEQFYNIIDFQSEMPGKLYPAAEVVIMDQHDDSDLQLNKQIIKKIEVLYQLMNIEITEPLDAYEFRVYMLAHKIGLTYQQEINVRDMLFESEKQIFIMKHLERLIPEVIRIEDMKRKIQLNGHFKDLKSYDF